MIQAAITVNIEVKDSFGVGDKIGFNYNLVSDSDIEVSFIPSIECLSAPSALLMEKKVSLTKGFVYNDSYSDKVVDESMEPQMCKAYIRIMEPFPLIKQKTFEIKANPSFEFEILLNGKNFIKDEEIRIDYTSEILDPEIKTILTYPSKKTEQITLPYSFKADKIGTYELEVTASKEGYKTITKKEQFGVIEKETKIEYTKLSELSKEEESKLWLWILGLIVVGGFFYWFYKKLK